MKWIFILFMLGVSVTLINSQDIGIGSKWVYNQGWFLPLPNQEDRRIIEIVGDTLISNDQYFLLEGTCECSEQSKLLMRWEGSKIFQYFNNSAHLLYDFNLNAGDSIKVDFQTSDSTFESTLVFIDSIGIYNDKKVQHISISENKESYADWYGVFMEDFGSVTWCITPQFPLCESGTTGLCEFITAQNDTINLSDLSNCIISSTRDPNAKKIKVYPNPSRNEWVLKNTTDVKEYKVYDLNGILLTSNNTDQKQEIIIDAAEFRGTIFFVELIGDHFRMPLKLMKVE